ncbi:MAG: biotin--[acetyl-CoA-carboxylase] ligase [Bacteroidetes bacterium]|nr:biotin--[acetyl-CoA-carboxylase] ligase [Bacteroidota bacterium]HET6243994.1 biotin--[acetyl-CoA-carboxylase] ligase [Bacteroidia bacterium]
MKTLFIGQRLIQLDKVESTNIFASELISNSFVPEGTLITAKEQTLGRGQRGTSWISEPGKNIILSVVLKPAFLSVTNQFQLNKALALAVRDLFLHYTLNNVTVKWPNDIYINDAKLAGILIQNQIKNAFITYSIVGIGINVNQEKFPWDIPHANSLKNITGIDYNLNECIEKLCEYIEKRYLQLRSNFTIDTEYLQNLYKFDQQADFLVNEQFVKGKITGITTQGKLVVTHSENCIKHYDLKEIKFYP